MTVRTPGSLSRFCRTVLPHIEAAADGRRLLKAAAEVVETDRWNSFDRFHETTRTLVRHYELSRAKAEVESIQTGGRIGAGRWVIQEAQDVRGATVDVVAPLRQRIHEFPFLIEQPNRRRQPPPKRLAKIRQQITPIIRRDQLVKIRRHQRQT